MKSHYFRFWLRIYFIKRWLGKRFVLWGCHMAGINTDGWCFLEQWDDRWD